MISVSELRTVEIEASLPKRSRGKAKAKGYKSAEHWPSTEDIDGFTYGLARDPDPADAGWASEVFNQGDGGHTSDYPPDEYYDQLAGEAEAISRLERGLL